MSKIQREPLRFCKACCRLNTTGNPGNKIDQGVVLFFSKLLFVRDGAILRSKFFNNYSSIPNGSAEWTIESEATRARGIIVLVKSN